MWLWSDWPGREGRPDTGIDLVAANADDGGLTAIQCKFYGRRSTTSAPGSPNATVASW
ncbi:hypothetical protein [Blastococcus capsensis]|uniref:restriction endonuclease n=1 Tax=Blastococcus capsensis TaxID=1564163 RepID=UPI00253F69B0|nr:hypothetical protein [Blastococcus capsensis]MDK3255971.1 hypothetical protein [Blastococcus capsensis]